MDDNGRSTALYAQGEQHISVERASKIMERSSILAYVEPSFQSSKKVIDGKVYYPISVVEDFVNERELKLHLRYEVTMFLEWIVDKFPTWKDVAIILGAENTKKATYICKGRLSYVKTIEVLKKLDFFLDEYVEQFLEEGGFLIVLEDVAKKIKVFQE